MKRVFRNIILSITSITLALSCVGYAGAVSVEADEATLIKFYDFERGLKELKNEDSNFSLSTSGGLIVHKDPEEREGSDKVDANGYVIMGTGANIRYYTQTIANGPLSSFDEKMGTTFYLCNTYDVPELKKTLPADVENDADGSALLDQQYPVDTVVRDAVTYKSYMRYTNPLKSISGDSAVVAFWAYAPKEAVRTGVLEYVNGNSVVNFNFDASKAEADKWNFYTYVIKADGITSYINGQPVENAYLIENAPSDYLDCIKNANAYLGATDESSLRTIENTQIDSVAYYNGDMSATEVAALYTKESDRINAVKSGTEPDGFIALDDASQFSSISTEYEPIIKEFDINGHTVKGVAVPENKKVTTKAGIKINDYPFAGKRLESISVGYWVKVNVKQAKLDKGKIIYDTTTLLSFMDDKKFITNPKEDSTSMDGFSFYYTQNNMFRKFVEGSYYEISGKLNNIVGQSPSEEVSKAAVENSGEWHYVTLSIDNNGMEYYLDGVKITASSRNQGTRFLDGYYRRLSGLSSIYAQYGMFGGSGNQYASMMMEFLTYSDTSIYFGFLPTTDYLAEQSSPIDVTRMSFFESELEDAQVEALYKAELAEIEKMPVYVEPSPEPTEGPTLPTGDINVDEKVNAQDALLALQAAAKLITATDEQIIAGDLNQNGKLDANDALVMLQVAARITTVEEYLSSLSK